MRGLRDALEHCSLLILSFLHHYTRVRQAYKTKEAYAPLSGHNDCLPCPILPHRSIRVLCNGKQMGLQLPSLTASIRLDDLGAIEVDALEGIDGNEDDTTVGVYAMLRVAISDGVENLQRC